MWTKKHQLMLGLILFLAVIYLFTSNAHTVERTPRITSDSPAREPANSNELSKSPRPIHVAEIAETTLPIGTPASGFTIFDRLYVRNGTLYVVASDSSSLPHLKFIISKPEDRGGGRNLDPTPQEMQVITPEQAKGVLGDHALIIEGMNMILYDTNQFMAHYYHWWGEIILGAMRVYSAITLLPGFQPPLPEASRFILPHVGDDSWRDRAGVNGPLMRAGFPLASIDRADFWKDLIALNRTFVFERAMIISRTGAHHSPLSNEWLKMISSTMNVTVPEHFWEPLREQLVTNTIGYLPVMDNAGVVVSSPKSSAPIVTYISRQRTGRRLVTEDHDGLIDALKELEAEGLCELNVAIMETMTFAQQIESVARSTIIIGVHGYLHDYEILARNMGHKHYAVWNDTTLTYPAGQWYKGVEFGDRSKFHGSSIPVHGPTVAQVVRERLTLRTP
ncbi:hypothetical protein CVT26_004600 [Gymnopilus dilepis]|uniref:Glycosyltransferase 61 catalytic domain-containing protein n=1 Tax=Gymnopilus dilepis TaxID=231916 RepID=A0A409WC70_9AGAR|nr:hypothetical protein CVT26_004600 [Gymnopilus dilepis]